MGQQKYSDPSWNISKATQKYYLILYLLCMLHGEEKLSYPSFKKKPQPEYAYALEQICQLYNFPLKYQKTFLVAVD